MEYYIEWRIELDADSREEAARKAFEIMQRPDTTATVFHVFDEHGDSAAIDLREDAE